MHGLAHATCNKILRRSVVRGFYICKDIWNPEIGELLMCEQEFGNVYDPYTASVVRDDIVVGHVP